MIQEKSRLSKSSGGLNPSLISDIIGQDQSKLEVRRRQCDQRIIIRQNYLDKCLKKDFRDFRRSIDQINLNIASKYFKNTVIEDPKDAKIINSEAKRQWSKDFMMRSRGLKRSKSTEIPASQ
jgi:hypothetical protein